MIWQINLFDFNLHSDAGITINEFYWGIELIMAVQKGGHLFIKAGQPKLTFLTVPVSVPKYYGRNMIECMGIQGHEISTPDTAGRNQQSATTFAGLIDDGFLDSICYSEVNARQEHGRVHACRSLWPCLPYCRLLSICNRRLWSRVPDVPVSCRSRMLLYIVFKAVLSSHAVRQSIINTNGMKTSIFW